LRTIDLLFFKCFIYEVNHTYDLLNIEIMLDSIKMLGRKKEVPKRIETSSFYLVVFRNHEASKVIPTSLIKSKSDIHSMFNLSQMCGILQGL